MTEKPVWVQQFDRPAGTEIKHIAGHWYLYERLSVYDARLKRKRKKSGRMLGTITEDGFVQSRRISQTQTLADMDIENREFGATAFLLSLTEGMRARLERHFPKCWRELYALALLKCKEQPPFKRMDFHYRTSFLEQVLGPVDFSPKTLQELLCRAGMDRDAIRSYMKEDLPADGIVMFDGHRIISASRNLEYARVGYDSRRRFLPQVNLLYMFSVSDGRRLPVFYKQFAGDVTDVTAFGDIVSDAGLSGGNVTVIADKGFESDFNEELLDDSGLGYVIAVRRGCADVGEIPDRPEKYQKAFLFRGRAIYCNEYRGSAGNTYLYYDMSLANDEAADFICRHEKTNAANEMKREKEDARRKRGKGKLTQEEYDRLQPVDVAEALQAHRANGTFILKTNRTGLNCAQAYYLYKTRQDIEQAFKSYDDTLDASASYMRDQYSFEAWLFINHLALQMLYAVLQTIADRELTAKYSFDDAMQFLKHIRANRIEGRWRATKVTRQTMELCRKLDIELADPEKLKGTLK